MNYASSYSNTAPKTAFTKAAMEAPLILLDQALTYLKNVIVTCDGVVYWSSGTLYWSDDIHIWFNDSDGNAIHNSIASGSIALADNDFAYVDLNETDDTVLTVSDAAITTDAASNFITYNRLVLGYRNTDDDGFYPVALAGVGAKIKSYADQTILSTEQARTYRERVAIADINSGATLLAAVSGAQYRLVDCMAIAIGGAVGATTTVDILGTQSSSGVKLATFAQAQLTQSTVLRPGDTGVTVLADGASFTACDTNTAITIGKTGSDLTTATHVDVQLIYLLY